MKTKKALYLFLLPVVGIVILLNILSDKYFVRLDLTDDNRYTLSQATEDILENLTEPVTVKVYFTEGLPQQIDRLRSEFKDLLIEYGNLSDGNLVFEFVDPNTDPELEQEALQAGIPQQMIGVREKDQQTQKNAFMGAVLQYGNQKEVIPSIPNVSTEYALSTSIKKMVVTNKPVIGLLQGHGEPNMQNLMQAYEELAIMYQVEPVSLTDTAFNLAKFSTVVVIAPTDSFPASHISQLDNFLASGKNLFVALNRVNGDFTTAQGTATTTGLEAWLTQKGVVVEGNFLLDANCASVSVQQQRGQMTFRSQVQFPYLPIISNFSDHPIVEGLEAMVLQFASTITYTGDTTVQFIPLLKSSERSATQAAPLTFDVQKKWTQNDFPLSEMTIGALLKGNIVGNAQSQMVVVADGDFPVNSNNSRVQPDNVHFMVNAIDWLSDDTGLVELRTKGIDYRPLDELEDSTRSFLKYLNFLLPILLIIIYGIIRSQQNKIKRIKRMREDYV